MRAQFFGPEASTAWNVLRLTSELGDGYTHHDVDIRDRAALAEIFTRYGRDVAVVIHTAAQPSHDWAVRDPFTDFDVNAVGTLNVLQNVRDHCIDAPVIHCSTNKVYGDRPNTLPLGDRAGAPVRAGHPRGHADRPLPALGLRRLEGRRRRDGAGVRPLLRHAHRVLPGRHADRAGARGDRAARLPGLRDAVQHGAAHVQDLRVQGQDGPRRDPQPRRGGGLRGVLP